MWFMLFVTDQMKLLKWFFLAMKTESVVLTNSNRLLCAILARAFSQASLGSWVTV